MTFKTNTYDVIYIYKNNNYCCIYTIKDKKVELYL